MTVKSIISVDVQAEAFEKFQALFDRYTDALHKTPDIWKKVGKQHSEIAGAAQKFLATVNKQNQQARDALETGDKQVKHLVQQDRLWTSMAKSTKSIASNILSATRSLLSWTGILGGIGGLLGAGGLWGIDRMAANIANQRRSSMGLGLSTGQQRAFQVNFGRAVDPDAYLGWINQIETDPTKAWSAYALGAAPTGNTENDAVRILKALRARAQSTPTNQLGLLPGQLGLSGVSTEDLRRLKSMSGAEFNQLVSGNSKDINALGVSDNVAKKWQDFTTQMERAGASILKTFVYGLAPLEKPLEHLSVAFTKFLEVLLKSDLVRDGIKNLSHWLESFSGEISAPKFLDDVKRFTSDVGDLADALHTITHPGEAIGKAWTSFREYFAPTPEGLKANSANFQRYLGRADVHFGLRPGMLEAVKQTERSGANAVSPKGAMGMFQLMPGTAKQYGVSDPFDIVQSANAAGKYLSDLQTKYNGDAAKTLAAYNYGPGNLDALLAKHPGNDWQRYLPRETSQYLMNAQPTLNAFQTPGVRVEIFNNTGGSASASASQLR